MDSKKPLDVGMSSSLIDLKAELLKKTQELQSSKSRQQGVQKSLKKSELLKSKSVYASSNKGVGSRSKKDLEAVAEEEKTLVKSRSILEAKTKLYEKMTSEALQHDEQEHPVLSQSLVNFTQKAIENLQESRKLGGSAGPSSASTIFEEDESVNPLYPVDEEEWTEFTDGLGRTRRCLKSDLPYFISRDDALVRPTNPASLSLCREAEAQSAEMKRQKWEQDMAETSEKEKVHYQDVLYDEVRSHGVGYFGFSKDEEARAEQLKELRKLSEQTGATRAKLAKEKSSKKAVLSERLKKIRAKQRAKRGLPPEEEEKSEEEGADDDDDDKETNEEKRDSGGEEGRKEMRPWDFGKTGVFGPRPSSFDELDEKWLKDRRSDRLPEFAPPSNLYSQGGLKRAYYGATTKPSATATSSSSSSSTSSTASPYSNFVRGSEESGKKGDELPPSDSPPPPPIPGPFKAPSQFWKNTSASASSTTQGDSRKPPKPVPIVDECSAPVAGTSFVRSDNKSGTLGTSERGRGTEIAPPPTFDYYHGQTRPVRPGGSGIKEEIMAQAVSSGLRTLREKFEAQERKKKKKMSEEDDKDDIK